MLKSSQFFQEPVKRMLRKGQDGPVSNRRVEPQASKLRAALSWFQSQKFNYHYEAPLETRTPTVPSSPIPFPLPHYISPTLHTPPLLFGKTGSGPLAPVGLALTVCLSLPQLLAWITTPSLKPECGSQGSPYRVVPQGPSALFETVCHQDLGLADYISLGGQ